MTLLRGGEWARKLNDTSRGENWATKQNDTIPLGRLGNETKVHYSVVDVGQQNRMTLLRGGGWARKQNDTSPWGRLGNKTE
jgi:hypothetical protein